MNECLRRIQAWHDAGRPLKPKQKAEKSAALVGINIGKNKDSKDAANDYTDAYALMAPYADYVTVNISSPNTQGLRDLQERGQLEELLKKMAAARRSAPHKPPLFVKLAPDLPEAQMRRISPKSPWPRTCRG